MARDEIQTTDPSGLSDQPVRMMRHEAPTNPESALAIPDLRMPLPDRNVPAVASFTCGLLAFLCSLIGYVVVCGGPVWLARVLAYTPAGSGVAVLLALAGLLLGVFGTVERLQEDCCGRFAVSS
jgi:hypothetical protein